MNKIISSITPFIYSFIGKFIHSKVKTILIQAGKDAYSSGKTKFEAWLAQQVSAGKITEEQKAEALVIADQGVEKLTAYLESINKNITVADTIK